MKVKKIDYQLIVTIGGFVVNLLAFIWQVIHTRS